MSVRIYPSRLSGTVRIPPSKSMAHRVLIAAALAEGESAIRNLEPSRDIEATLGILSAMGAALRWSGDTVYVRGGLSAAKGELFCDESGSTLRFLIPVSLLFGGGRFTGRGRLLGRPQGPYFDLFREKGVAFSADRESLSVAGTLLPGRYVLPGDVSSQFATGLLLALPLLPGDSELVFSTPLQSAPYVALTVEALARFGVRIEKAESGFHVPGGQHFRPAEYAVEGDWSQAAFFLTANFLGSDVKIEGLDPDSGQGDRAAAEILRSFSDAGRITVDGSDVPDIVPILSLAAALRDGETTRFAHCGRLRAKESDRLAAVARELAALGADIHAEGDTLIVRGVPSLRGGAASSHGDHRMAMTLAVAATVCREPVTVDDGDCVAKSYPRFWEDYQALGGRIV